MDGYNGKKMGIIGVLLKIAGKDNFNLNPNIGVGYIIQQC